MPNAASPALPNLGQTYYGDRTIGDSEYGPTVGLEGTLAWKDDIAPSTSKVKQRRSNQQRLFMLVRNTSGGALLPRVAVKWEAEFMNKRVNAVAGAAEQIAGVVDENLPEAGVPDNHLFWLCVEGPHLCKKASGSAIDDGTFLITGAAGAVVTNATIPVNGSYVGRTIETAASAATQVLVNLRCHST